jgi:hypothetical protein
MRTAALLDELQRLGVDIHSDGDKLKYDAPKGAMTADLRAELAEHKGELLELLKPKTGWHVLVVLPDGSERWMDRHALFCWVAERMGEKILNGSRYPGEPDITHLYKARSTLMTRLDKGRTVIDELKAKGKDPTRAEALWLELLDEYKLCELQIAACEG